MAKKFGKIPIEEKPIVVAVIEAVSQGILEETDEKLAKANAKLGRDLKRYKKGAD